MAKAKGSKKTDVTTVLATRKRELAAIDVGVNPLVDKATALVVETGEEETVAYGLSNDVKRLIKQADTRRKAITQPLEAAKKETIKLFKDITAPLVEAKDVIEAKILAYREVEDERVRQEEEKRQAELDRLEAERIAAEERAAKLKTPKAVAKAVALATSLEEQMNDIEDVVVEDNRGAASVVKRWVCEVENVKIMERRYLMPNIPELNQAVRDGVRTIKGVRIYQTSSVRGR